ncbi:hypothetical protein [Methanoculleus sp. MH98A]|uniref:hypothetical protein n=1 Tax=Methanoculleus sp. MH98A TaxID=1495314 RepID=UPI000AAF09AE|nr:hypothetical protein [Methanoculleus sp. MH98A]
MKFHYLLVDDLLEKGEFERRVEEKVAESGDLLDERTAAMLVVKDLGRSHIRIRDLAAAPSLACFFAKVLSVGEPREFERPDGTPGIVANVTVGDETGRARLTLWDEKAAGVSEIEAGDVLEILAGRRGKERSPTSPPSPSRRRRARSPVMRGETLRLPDRRGTSRSG